MFINLKNYTFQKYFLEIASAFISLFPQITCGLFSEANPEKVMETKFIFFDIFQFLFEVGLNESLRAVVIFEVVPAPVSDDGLGKLLLEADVKQNFHPIAIREWDRCESHCLRILRTEKNNKNWLLQNCQKQTLVKCAGQFNEFQLDPLGWMQLQLGMHSI